MPLALAKRSSLIAPSATLMMGAEARRLKAKGIDEIWCIAVNDAFVMAAWGKDNNAFGKVRMMGDAGFAEMHVHIVGGNRPIGRPRFASAGGKEPVEHCVVLAEQLLDLFALEPVVLVVIGHGRVGQVAGLIVQVHDRVGRNDVADRIHQMDVADRVHLAVAPHQIDLIGSERSFGLRDDRVTGHDEGVGLVIVNKLPAGHVHGAAGMFGLYK